MSEQIIVFAVLVLAMALFIQERWRYDLVALAALLTLVVAGPVPAQGAFDGFGHPAVITVASILVVSRGLAESGVVEALAGLLGRVGGSPTALVAALTVAVTLTSAFMNNVGALALLMPVALQLAKRHEMSPSVLLMPIAFGSLLGGMTTLIGTPPNIIIGAFRGEAVGTPFSMFDFTPVGAAVAVVGVLFVTFLGWRLIPRRGGQATTEDLFQIGEYTTELVVPERDPASVPAAGRRLDEMAVLSELHVVVASVLRRRRPGREEPERVASPPGSTVLAPGDRLLVEVAPEDLDRLLAATGLELVGSEGLGLDQLGSDQVAVLEAVVMADSFLVGSTSVERNLRNRWGVNILGISRQGSLLRTHLKDVRFRVGDVLLVQCRRDVVRETLPALGCLPLAERELGLGPGVKGRRRRIALGLGIFGLALAALVTGFLPAQAAFSAAALLMVLSGLVPVRHAYRAIDWPVIVLLAAMIPVGGALESSGGAATLADAFMGLADGLPLALTVGGLLVVTMFLSDVMNNAATAVIMAPIALSVSERLDASADPFLMAVAVGASCAFLTPIGHQSNTLVMGPGGYRFGDYWRMGLPLEILVAVVSVPVILWVFPA